MDPHYISSAIGVQTAECNRKPSPQAEADEEGSAKTTGTEQLCVNRRKRSESSLWTLVRFTGKKLHGSARTTYLLTTK